LGDPVVPEVVKDIPRFPGLGPLPCAGIRFTQGGQLFDRAHPAATPAIRRELHHNAQVRQRLSLPRHPARGDLVEHRQVIQAGEAGHRD
jgi:hypothetical protein